MKNNITNNLTNEELTQIIEKNMALVTTVVKKFKPRNPCEYEEFMHIGCIGLWKAAKRFDPKRAKFSTMAWHYIRYEILRHIQAIKAQSMQTIDNSVQSHTNKYPIWEILPDSLSDKEKDVINMRLAGYTFVDIGNEMGFSRGWANNTYKTAIRKIKSANGTEKETHIVMQ